MAMQFVSLHIERERWGEDKGRIFVTLKTEGETGEMKLILPESAGLEIMKAAADIVAVEGAKQAAAFRNEFLDSVNGKLIEATEQ
jgi:hypothetical protein